MPGWPGGLGNRLQDGRAAVDQGLGDRLQNWWNNTTFFKPAYDELVGGLTAPGDVMSGAQPTMAADPQTGEFHTDPELMDRAGALAGAVTLGAGAVPAEADALRMGIKATLGDKLQGRARDPRYWNPASATKLSMPWEDIQPVYGKGGTKLLPEQPFDWSQVKKGDVFVPLIGDRTIAGRPIIGYNDVRFENAVPAEGGSGFTRRANNPQNTFWAADPGASSKLANHIASLQQEGRNVFGATAAMGAESGDYALQNTRAAWEALKAQEMTDKARNALYKAIDAKMKSDWGKDFPAVTDWPGMHKVTEEYWKGNGKARTKFAKALDTKPMADLGAPDMGIVRKIISDPKQYDAPPLGVGSSIVRLTGDAKAIHGGDVRRPHSTYRSQTGPGEYVGTLDKLIPGWDFFTDFAKTRPDLTRADRQGYTFMRSNVFQTASPEWLDRIVNYASSPQGKKLGLAGAIAAGLLTVGQAQEMFGPDAAATESPRL